MPRCEMESSSRRLDTIVVCTCLLLLLASVSVLAVNAQEIRYEFDDPDGFWDAEILNDTGKYYFDIQSGWLTVRAQQGGVIGGECNTPPNLFRLPIDWDESLVYILEMHIDFLPTSNFQIAGPILFSDVDNFVMLGRAFCSDPGMGEPCVGDGIYFDYEEDAVPFPSHSTNYATDPGDDMSREVWLKIEACGDHVQAYYSRDGEDWIFVGQQVIDFVPSYAGFGAWNSCTRAPAIYAHFDYFALRIGAGECGGSD